MLIFENNTYRLRCDMCEKQSDHYSTQAELLAALHFGNSLWDEPTGWVAGRDPEQITGDESVYSDELYKWQTGIIVTGKHLCPSCRGLANRYYN